MVRQGREEYSSFLRGKKTLGKNLSTLPTVPGKKRKKGGATSLEGVQGEENCFTRTKGSFGIAVSRGGKRFVFARWEHFLYHGKGREGPPKKEKGLA